MTLGQPMTLTKSAKQNAYRNRNLCVFKCLADKIPSIARDVGILLGYSEHNPQKWRRN